MKKARIREDCDIMELAKLQYGDEFPRVFSYRTPNQPESRTFVRPDAIARRYRKLNGLTEGAPVAVKDE